MIFETTETPVVIVGGGPVGLAMAIELSRRNVRSILIEQGDGSIEHPRTGLVAIRTMEAFRQWGLAQDVRACGFPDDYELSMVFCTSLNGLLLDKEQYPSMGDSVAPPETPEKKQRCPQLWLQPILTKAALEAPLASILFHHRFEYFEESETSVTVTIKDLETSAEKKIMAQYLLACDGGTSSVRKLAGINMPGKLLSYSVNILIRAPDLVHKHAMGEAERYMFVGPEGMWGNLTVVDGSEIWRLTVLGSEEKMNLESFDVHYWIRRAFGMEAEPGKIFYELLSVNPWRRSEMLADHYMKGRVLLVGDSAHVMSPTGGMGMNTGIQEVLDLGWKLQGTLEGWGGPNLLSSYEIERRPIAARNISFSSQNFKAWKDTPNPEAVCDLTATGQAVRTELGKRLRDSTRVEWESLGLQLGHRYEDSPICVNDGTPPTADDFKDYVPTARPGSRAPHGWLKDGRSTLDLFGDGFVLLDFAPEGSGTQRLEHAFASKNIPLTCIPLCEPEIAKLYAGRFVLVRPDGHVAWRGDKIVDPDSIALIVSGSR